MIDFLSLVITGKCNCKCLMCNCWKIQRNDIDKSCYMHNVFDDPYIKTNIEIIEVYGGEPALRKDLAEILIYAIDSLEVLNKLIIISNATIYNNLEHICTQVLDHIRRSGKNVSLRVVVSLDGIGKTHDNIRGLPGAFTRVLKTVKRLNLIKSRHPNFDYVFNCVINSMNIDEIDCLTAFGDLLDTSVGFTYLAEQEVSISAKRGDFNSKNLLVPVQKLHQVFTRLKEKSKYNSQMIDSFANNDMQIGHLEHKKRLYECSFYNNSILIDSDGACYVCPVTKEGFIGNICLERVSCFIAQINEAREKISPACINCNTDCSSYISLVKNKIKDTNVRKILFGIPAQLEPFMSNIVAIVNTDKEIIYGEKNSIKIIHPEEILDFEFDCIIIVQENEKYSIHQQLLGMGIESKKIYFNVSEL